MNFWLGFILGILSFIGFGGWRAMRTDEWDDSNFFNWLRVLGFLFIHPDRFGDMYYLTENQRAVLHSQVKRAFPYIKLDEYKGVTNTR